MTRPNRLSFHFWLPLTAGLAAVCGLLLTVHSTTVAANPQEQPADILIVWLVPPGTPSVSGPWPLAAETHQSGWQAQSAIVEQRLAALEEAGRIGDFELLADSVAFAVSATAGLPAEIGGWPEVARVAAPDAATPQALAAWWRQGLGPAGASRPILMAAQQTVTLTLNLGLHSGLASGAAPRPEPIALNLTHNGEVIAVATATPFPDGSGGYLYVATLCEPYYGTGGGGGGCGGCYPAIEPGDVLQAVQAGQAISLTVPALTALADQDTATVYGQSSPTATLDVYFYRYSDPAVAYRQIVTATALGDFQANLSGLTPFAPRDYGYVFADAAGNHIYARYNVPFLRTEIEGEQVSGIVAPCTAITATLHDNTGALRNLTYGFACSDGAFDIYLDQAFPQAGDNLVVTAAGQIVSMTIPLLTAHPDATHDVVGGAAPPGAVVQVDLYRRPLQAWESALLLGAPDYSLSVTATLTGAYTADFGLIDVTAGDYGAAWVTDARGYQACRRFAVPFLRARLGDYFLTGQVNGGGPITITVLGGSGILREMRSAYAYGNGYFSDSDWDGGLRLIAGDWVTVTGPAGVKTGLRMPQLTASADLARSLVHGQSPPNSPLRIEVSPYWWYPPYQQMTGGGDYTLYTVWVTSTASGVYTADFSSLTTFQQGYTGAAFHINPEGHEAYLEFSVPATPFVRVQSGSNYVDGILPAGESAIVTLRDASGRVKATATAWPYYEGAFDVYLYQGDQPAIIVAGDTVEVGIESMLITVAVPTLAVQVDLSADRLSGQSPPNAPLAITWRRDDPWSWGSNTWIVTSTAAGAYTLDLSGQVDLKRGDTIEVAWTDGNGNQVWLAHSISRLVVTLNGDQVSVRGPIYAPVTLTLLSAGGVPLSTTSAALDGYGRAWFYYPPGADDAVLKTGQTLLANLPGEVMTLTLPHLTARADVLSNAVSGEAPAGARLIVAFNYWWGYYWPVTATVTGAYSTDFGRVVDIGPDDIGEVIYLHPDGHLVTLDYAAPHVEVTLGDSYVGGVVAGSGAITVTLRDGSGGFKGMGSGFAWQGFSISLTDAQGEPVPVTGGDLVIVESSGGVMAFTVPALTVSFDRETGILTGTAPATVWLQVTLMNGSRRVQNGSDGIYVMDWSDLSPVPGEQGLVYHTDGQGNQTRLYFTVPYHTIYLPLVAKGP
jgi:hypothetical protein